MRLLLIVALLVSPLSAEMVTQDEGFVLVRRLSAIEELAASTKKVQLDPRLGDEALSALRRLTSLEVLRLEYCSKVTGAGLAHLAELPALREIDLSYGPKIGEEGFRNLARVASLRTIVAILAEDVTDAGLAHLGKLPALTRLDLTGCEQVTDVGAKHLAGCKSLTSLDLNGCRIGDAGAGSLGGLRKLEDLDLGNSKSLTDSGLAKLANLKLLRLGLSTCPSLTDEGIVAALKRQAKLEALDLSFNYKLSEAVVKGLARKNRALKELELDAMKLGATALRHVVALRRLERLSIRNCNALVRGGLKELPKLAKLRELDVGGTTTIDVTALAQIARLPSLEVLNLEGSSGLRDLSPLRKCKKLRDLDVSFSGIGDDALPHIAAIPTLKALNLSRLKGVTSAGLRHLYPMQGLEELLLVSETLSEEAVDTLRRALPNCKIER